MTDLSWMRLSLALFALIAATSRDADADFFFDFFKRCANAATAQSVTDARMAPLKSASEVRIEFDRFFEGLDARRFRTSLPEEAPHPGPFGRAPFPSHLTRTYDAATGALTFGRRTPLFLASENGREKLSAVRISVTDDWTVETFTDYLHVMQSMPDLRLLALTAPVQETILRNHLKQASPEVRERVHLQVSSPRPVRAVPETSDPRIPFLLLGAEWTQDASKPLIAPTPTTVAPLEDSRLALQFALNEMNAAGLLKIEDSSFYFEGGNVIVGDQHIFVGLALTQELMQRYGITRSEARQILEAEWGRPIFEIGIADLEGVVQQLDFHIDLTMTVVFSPVKRKEVILLGSTKKLLDALGDLPHSSLQTSTELKVFQVLNDPKTLEALALREKRLEIIRARLESAGYEVQLIPYLSHPAQTILNYNNVILSENQVIFPVHGFTPVDRAAETIYRRLGFTLEPVRVIQKSYRANGGIRCLSETFRKNYVTLPEFDSGVD